MSSVRRWLARPDQPEIIKTCSKIFDSFYKRSDSFLARLEEGRDADFNGDDDDDDDGDFDTKKSKELARVRYGGIIYSRESTHVGSSQILFFPDGGRDTAAVPALIQKIFVSGTGINLEVRRLKRRHARVDPFAKYVHFPAQLYSKDLQEKQKITIDKVKCHFASYPWSDKDTAVLSLSRVSLLEISVRKASDMISTVLKSRRGG